MQLDKTSIVITQRTFSDTLDLSLMVLRHYFPSILLVSLIGVLPFAILNFVLTWPITQYESLESAAIDRSPATFFRFRYYCIMIGAVYLQAPLAFSLLTSFIGQSVFTDHQSFKSVFQSIRANLSSTLFVLGILRFGLLTYVALIALFLDPSYQPVLEILGLFFLMMGFGFLTRAFRPFAPEILVLERSPLLKKKKNAATHQSYRQRSRWLYGAQAGESFGTTLAVVIVATLMTCCICFGAIFLLGALAGVWRWGMWMDWFLFPASLWCVGAWMTIIRFLTYMNLRIRCEGWEIELKLKAESERLLKATANREIPVS